MTRNGLAAMAVVALLVSPMGWGGGLARVEATDPGRTITVTGRGTVEVVPDVATVSLGVEARRPSAQEAQEAAAATMARMVHRLLRLGIPPGRMTTLTVLLVSVEEPTTHQPAYEAIQRLAVRVDDPGRAGAVIDAAVGAGANLVGPVSLGIRHPSAPLARALRLAVQDTEEAARAMASTAGLRAVHLVALEEMGPPAIPRITLVGSPGTASTSVLPGVITVEVQVRATYAF